jgi:hypothetical protein
VKLVRRGKASIAYATPLTNFAIRQVLAGRRVGTRRNCRDVFAVAAQQRRGFSLDSLNSDGREPNIWVEALTDNRQTPLPDQVAFRLDFPAWLGVLKRRDQKLVKFLAVGNTPAEAAQQFRVSQARVSQLRAELRVGWQAFQG